MRLDHAGTGLRVAVKDLIDVAGLVTTCGSRLVADNASPARKDATCLEGLRSAEARGEAALVGKTNLHELGFGITGINPWYGTPRNPWDESLVPGGSSSGSAVAVATGEADLALGTDTGGSVRIPAACCAVFGLKTTWGRVATDGVVPLAPSLDTVGLLATRAETLVEGMALLEPGFSTRPEALTKVGRIRLPAEQAVEEALEEALCSTGAELVDLELPDWQKAHAAAMCLMSAEAWECHGHLWKAQPHDLGADVAARLAQASRISSAEATRAIRFARQFRATLERLLDQVQVLALPTLSASPPAISNAARLKSLRQTSQVNLAGLPALSLPVAGAEPLPPSLQLVGSPGGEELLLGLALCLQDCLGPPPRPPGCE